MSAMAGATKPNIIIGIINPRNSLKMPLNVKKILTITSGRKFPHVTPNAMAIMILPSKPIFIVFINFIVSCKDNRKLSFTNYYAFLLLYKHKGSSTLA
jgi:hypothetical protein